MKRTILLCLGLAVIFSIATTTPALSATPAVIDAEKSGKFPSHMSKSKNPRGCRACHKSHGRSKDPLLRAPSDRLCLICHGPYREVAEDRGSDVFSSLQKRSKHPVIETSQYHKSGETLPEANPVRPRHVACYDCHNPHNLSNEKKMGRIMGASHSGQKKVAEKDSEVCYKCHGDSANRPATSQNMKLLFDQNNQSYHPIEKTARKRSVSLSKDMQRGLAMDCTDCHEPHGSDYPPLLKKNYTTTEGAESSYSYDLCYSCHRRESILGNESFSGPQSKPYGHKEHLVFVKASCHTCHAAHGSPINPSLIEFDQQVVTGAGQFVPGVKGSPTCILTCHGKEHGVALPTQEQSIKKKK